ncbi:ATP-binding protein [uncultured Treponema sp.]|uniref:ATP-binding protein n=1 Tax=uncultured Treponema sp. TaxID=162155 RepID=UPI0025D118CA|nr:ATP-binding protein [uncultured Treponema sp.]
MIKEELFLGRKGQSELIEKFLNSDKNNAALVYGRRRVGKTELIKHCLKKTETISIYYECKETSELNNIESISEIIAETFGLPPLAFDSFESSLTFLYKQASEKNLIVVIDEYPYIRKVIKGLDSIIQSLIDNNKSKSKLKLILCGSYVETMKSLLSEENPLFGRFDLVMNLKAMDYYDSALFYKNFKDEDKIRIYSVFGGIPYYNRFIDSSKSVKQNIIDLIASPDGRFANEVQMYLKSEISKMTNAYEVFEALAKGYIRFSDILSQSKVTSSPTLADVLDKLIKMDVVVKESPINDENNKKKTGYYVSDQLTLFYFKYIFRNLSRIAVMEPDAFFDKFISKDFEEHYVPKAFEQICKQFLIKKNRSGELVDSFEKIGKYYYDDSENHKNGEFDIVTENDNSYIFYEAKFRECKLDKNLILNEIQQVNSTGLVCSKYGFFSKSGYKKIDKDFKSQLILYTINDLFV